MNRGTVESSERALGGASTSPDRRPQLLLARDDGFFTNVFSVLGAIEWCKGDGSVPVVRFDSGAYLDPARGPNWWEYFFEPISDIDAMSLPVESRADLLKFSRFVADRVILQRRIAADLIRRHIRVRTEVQEGVDSFWERNLRGRFVVGLHVRGTDKFVEQPRMDLDAASRYIEHLVRARPRESWCVFLATDEAACARWARERFADNVVLQDALRSDNGHALHKEVPREDWERGPFAGRPPPPMVRRPPYRIGLEAIRDALLLARSDVLLASQSCLSYFAAAFNPDIPVVEAGGRLPPAWLSAFPEMKAKEQTIQDILRIAEERARIIFDLQHAAQQSGGAQGAQGKAPPKADGPFRALRQQAARLLHRTRKMVRRRAKNVRATRPRGSAHET